MSIPSRALSLVLWVSSFGCKTAQPTPTAMPPQTSTPEHAHPHHKAHEPGPGHFAAPERYVAEWNDPERDAWQKPEEIVAALQLAPGATVADLGAGTGYLLPTLSHAVGPQGHVIALDIEPAMLRFLSDAKTQNGWSNVVVQQAPPDRPGLPPTSVDAVVTLNVWHHVENRVAYASRLRETLKPGGTFVIVDFLKEQTEGFGPPLAMRLSPEEVIAELAAAGFEAERVSETMPRHYLVRGRTPKSHQPVASTCRNNPR